MIIFFGILNDFRLTVVVRFAGTHIEICVEFIEIYFLGAK